MSDLLVSCIVVQTGQRLSCAADLAKGLLRLQVRAAGGVQLGAQRDDLLLGIRQRRPGRTATQECAPGRGRKRCRHCRRCRWLGRLSLGRNGWRHVGAGSALC